MRGWSGCEGDGAACRNGLGAMAGLASKGPNVGDWSLANQHLLNTVRILVRGNDGTHSVGTGFMHKFCELGDEAIQCVVTNRHVIAGSVSCELVFRSQRVDAADAPVVASTIRVRRGFRGALVQASRREGRPGGASRVQRVQADARERVHPVV